MCRPQVARAAVFNTEIRKWSIVLFFQPRRHRRHDETRPHYRHECIYVFRRLTDEFVSPTKVHRPRTSILRVEHGQKNKTKTNDKLIFKKAIAKWTFHGTESAQWVDSLSGNDAKCCSCCWWNNTLLFWLSTRRFLTHYQKKNDIFQKRIHDTCAESTPSYVTTTHLYCCVIFFYARHPSGIRLVRVLR